jgi:hypothetical protein
MAILSAVNYTASANNRGNTLTLIENYIPLSTSLETTCETPYFVSAPKIVTNNGVTCVEGNYYLTTNKSKNHVGYLKAYMGKDNVTDSVTLDIKVTPNDYEMVDNMVTKEFIDNYGNPDGNYGVPCYAWVITSNNASILKFITTEIIYKDDIPSFIRITYIQEKMDSNTLSSYLTLSLFS